MEYYISDVFLYTTYCAHVCMKVLYPCTCIAVYTDLCLNINIYVYTGSSICVYTGSSIYV